MKKSAEKYTILEIIQRGIMEELSEALQERGYEFKPSEVNEWFRPTFNNYRLALIPSDISLSTIDENLDILLQLEEKWNMTFQVEGKEVMGRYHELYC